MLKRIWWSTFRVCYWVDMIFFASVLLVRWFPPADGNYARAFGSTLALFCSYLMILWAFVPSWLWEGNLRKPKVIHGS